jgi:23S rRNA pseudouridine1911/1915/1917 synthase
MKEEFSFTLPEEVNGLRLDQAVTAYLQENYREEISREKIREAILEGELRLNSIVVSKAGYKIKGGEKVEIALVKELSDLIPDSSVQFEIIFEDDAIIVVNKPAGLVVHPGAGVHESTLVHGILSKYSIEETESGERPGIVHRLDKGTSGLMVVAKTTKAKLHLQNQFKPPRTVHREYLCIVKGSMQIRKGAEFQGGRGRINVPLLRSERNRTIFTSNFDEGKDAVTNFEILKSSNGYSLIKCVLETGRTHQIRAHMKYIALPIVGDLSYGGENKAERPMLHAKNLNFIHPITLKEVSYSSNVPEDFENILENLGLKV